MPISRAKRRPTARGFATVEMLVAFAIVMAIGTVAIASLGARHGATLRDETAQVALLLQQARMEALESGTAVVIRWDEDARVLQAGGQTHQLADGVEAVTSPSALQLYPSGESSGFQMTLSNRAGSHVLALDWLTGQVKRVQ